MKPVRFALILGVALATPAMAEDLAMSLPPVEDAGISQSVPAPKAPESTAEVISTVRTLISAAKGGEWPLFVGTLLMLTIWFLQRVWKIKEKVGKDALPWLAAAGGIGVTVATGLIQGASLGDGILQGLATGAVAVGLWEMILKRLVTKDEEEKKE